MPPSIAELTRRFLEAPTAPSAGPVEPYDVASAFRVEPATAWSETVLVLKMLGISPLPKIPADWSSHVRQQPAVRLLPMAAGHYPQMVSDLSRVLASEPATSSVLVKLDVTSMAHAINETALALWNAGNVQESKAVWLTLPESAVRSFNLGVAALSLGTHGEAATQLKQATVQLPDSSGWRALAEIYLTLADVEI